MKVTNIDVLLDGGTVSITTDQGTYCFYIRIKTKKYDQLYKNHPNKDNLNIIEDRNLSKEIILASEEFLRNNGNQLKSNYKTIIDSIGTKLGLNDYKLVKNKLGNNYVFDIEHRNLVYADCYPTHHGLQCNHLGDSEKYKQIMNLCMQLNEIIKKIDELNKV